MKRWKRGVLRSDEGLHLERSSDGDLSKRDREALFEPALLEVTGARR